MTPQLCSVYEGNGVVKIPGGVSTCDHCDGKCYEPAPDWRARVRALIDLIRPAVQYKDNGHHYCRGCSAGTANGWQHDAYCPIRSHEIAVDEARKALVELDALVRATPDREDV